MDESVDDISSNPVEVDVIDGLNTSGFDDVGILEEDALEHIAGYIIHKKNLQEYLCHQTTFT